MLRLIIPLVALAGSIWVTFYVLGGRKRKQSFSIASKLAISVLTAGLVLLLIYLAFYFVELSNA